MLPSAELDEELKRSGLPGGAAMPAMRDTPAPWSMMNDSRLTRSLAGFPHW